MYLNQMHETSIGYIDHCRLTALEINRAKRTLYRTYKHYNYSYKQVAIMNATLINWTLNTINPQFEGFKPPFDMLESIAKLQALPPLPGIALRIMQLATDPTADIDKLAAIVELDPLLSAQIIRWASSPLYGYPGKIISVREAISRVLGFDFVFNLAFGLAALAPLKASKDGVIGMRSFWVQAMLSTRLMHLLNVHLPLANRLPNTELFLSGLLHNIGFPLLGDQFPVEFDYVNKLIPANPNMAVYDLERFVLGVEHGLLGAWLLQHWGMPKPVIDVVYHHHNANYRGENYQLNLLTYLTDCLVGAMGIGDAQAQVYTDEHLLQLNLPVKAIEESLDRLNDSLADIIITAEMVVG